VKEEVPALVLDDAAKPPPTVLKLLQGREPKRIGLTPEDVIDAINDRVGKAARAVLRKI
jgi:hypothetical protein